MSQTTHLNISKYVPRESESARADKSTNPKGTFPELNNMEIRNNKNILLLEEVCKYLEHLTVSSGIDHFKEIGGLNEWWEKVTTTKREKEEAAVYKRNQALEQCLSYKKKMLNYARLMLDLNLEQDDRDYFAKKISKIQHDIGELTQSHPGLAQRLEEEFILRNASQKK